MYALRPFFLLVGRASVFWIGAMGVLAGALIVTGVARPDERINAYVDPAFFAAVMFPAFSGWLAGAILREFQHTTFAALLPAVRSRVALGYLIAGVGVTGVVVGIVAIRSAAPPGLVMLCAVGLAAYCLGSVIIGGRSGWSSAVTVAAALVISARSRELARLSSDHPWTTAAVCLGLATIGFVTVFARSTFRQRPLRATKPFPGRYALEKSGRYERDRRIQSGTRTARWRAGYLGAGPWPWVRAAIHETHGSQRWRHLSRLVGPVGPFLLLAVLYAWSSEGTVSAAGVGRAIYDALFRSPYQPLSADSESPFAFVLIALAAAGVVTALISPVALSDGVYHPLSRRHLARVRFRGGLVDVGVFLLIVAPVLFAVGHLTGWLVGYEVRFDFMPYFFRVLTISMVLMPLAGWGRVRLLEATRRRSANTIIGVIAGVTGYVIAVAVCAAVLAASVPSLAAELVVLMLALLASQLVYAGVLSRYYRTADLV